MRLTINALREALPGAPEAWLIECVKQLPLNGFTTEFEAASFLAQVAHESLEFTRLEEKMYYRAPRLAQVWPRFAQNPKAVPAQRVPNDLAFEYERNPVRLANFVYANRMGNGDEASGDGWRFHGRGPIQLTGRRNYTKCAAATGFDLIGQPELLLYPEAGLASAFWYWGEKDLDGHDDDADVRAETRAINGGEIGQAHRQRLFDHILKTIS